MQVASTNVSNKVKRHQLINERLKTLSLHCGKGGITIVTIPQIVTNYLFRWSGFRQCDGECIF